MRLKNREERVYEFREAANKGTILDNPEELPMIFRCIEEEYAEFVEAVKNWSLEQNEETRAQVCKEWADLQYVVSQAAVFLEIPSDEAFHRVHESNMTKVVDGKVIYREDGKILKPEGYQPPDMRGL